MDKSFTIHDLPLEERPRERLVQLGVNALSGQELIQLLLGSGGRGESVTVTSQKLLSRFGSLHGIAEASIGELSQVNGIGLAKAAQLKAACELGRRTSSPASGYTSKELTDPGKVYKLVRAKLADHAKEHFYLIVLNSRNYAIHEVSLGTLNASLVHPREAFTEAIKAKAAAVIFAHNHPSGDPEPSPEDVQITKVLEKTGKLMGIPLLDHVILGKDTWWSWAESKENPLA